MALDRFYHNKIESMKLEIIQGQAVLRRLEAQRNDYNSRGGVFFPSSLLSLPRLLVSPSQHISFFLLLLLLLFFSRFSGATFFLLFG